MKLIHIIMWMSNQIAQGIHMTFCDNEERARSNINSDYTNATIHQVFAAKIISPIFRTFSATNTSQPCSVICPEHLVERWRIPTDTARKH